MKLNPKNALIACLFWSAVCVTQFSNANVACADEPAENISDAVSASESESQEQKSEKSDGSKSQYEGSAQVKSAPEWVYHTRGVLGSAWASGLENFKSDRLGAAIYAGAILNNIELPLFLADAQEFALGMSYQTFTGSNVSQDQSVALQSLGAQARFILAPRFLYEADLSIHAGVALQRLVFESNSDKLESTKLGGAMTAGAYARWSILGPVDLLAGADLVAGSASWVGVAAGLEVSF